MCSDSNKNPEEKAIQMKQIGNSPVWRKVEELSVPTAVFSPTVGSEQDTYLDANTSETFLARDFHPIEQNPNSPTKSGSGID